MNFIAFSVLSFQNVDICRNCCIQSHKAVRIRVFLCMTCQSACNFVIVSVLLVREALFVRVDQEQISLGVARVDQEKDEEIMFLSLRSCTAIYVFIFGAHDAIR